MLMVPMPPALMEHREDFNRADSTSLGSDWRLDFNTMKIATNRLQFKTPANGDGRAGAWASFMGVSAGYYNGGRLLTDNWALETQLIAPVGGAALDNGTTVGAAMLDGGPASGMVLVYGIFSRATSGTAAAIMTLSASAIPSPGSGTSLTGETIRSQTSSGIAATDLMRFERKMVTATRSIFTLYKNGTSYLTWDDTGGVVPAGDRTKRRWFVQNEGNFPIFQSAFYSPAMDWVRAYDLKS